MKAKIKVAKGYPDIHAIERNHSKFVKKKIKPTTKATLARYQKTLEEAVRAGTKLNTARKALVELNQTVRICDALEEISNLLEHYNRVVRNTMHNIAVLELKEDI